MKIYRGSLFTEPGLTPIIIFTRYGIVKYYIFMEKEFETYRKKLFDDIKIVGYTDFSKRKPQDNISLEIKGKYFRIYEESKYSPFAYLSVGKDKYISVESKFKISKHIRIFFSHK